MKPSFESYTRKVILRSIGIRMSWLGFIPTPREDTLHVTRMWKFVKNICTLFRIFLCRMFLVEVWNSCSELQFLSSSRDDTLHVTRRWSSQKNWETREDKGVRGDYVAHSGYLPSSSSRRLRFSSATRCNLRSRAPEPDPTARPRPPWPLLLAVSALTTPILIASFFILVFVVSIHLRTSVTTLTSPRMPISNRRPNTMPSAPHCLMCGFTPSILP